MGDTRVNKGLTAAIVVAILLLVIALAAVVLGT